MSVDDATVIEYLKASLGVAGRQRFEACEVANDLRVRLDLAERRLKWIEYLTTQATQGINGSVPRAAITNALGLTQDIRYVQVSS